MDARRERLVFACAACVLAALALLPLLATRLIPTLDDPNHLSAVYIWRELAAASSPLHAFYEARIVPVSYLGHYGLAFLLSYLGGAELGHKLALAAYILAIPTAAYFWCRATGRSVWLSLLVMPLAFSACWSRGYYPYNFGIAAFFFGVLTQDRLLAAPSRQRWVAAGLAAAACYFGHPFPLALLFGCTAVLWVLHGASRRSIAWSALSFVPSVLLLLWQSRQGRVGTGRMRAALGPEFPVLDPRVWVRSTIEIPAHAVRPLADVDGAIGLSLLFGLTLLFWIASRSPSREPRARRDSIRDARGLGLALALFGVYLVLPTHFNEPVYMWVARGRVATPIAFFLLLSPPLTERSRLRWLALAGALAMAYVPVGTALRYREFDAYVAPAWRALEACSKDAQVLTIRLGDQRFPGLARPVFRQLPSWVQVVHGGYSPQWFTHRIAFPFRVTRRLRAPQRAFHEDYRSYLRDDDYGCALTYQLPPNEDLGKTWALARESGPWRLYLRR